MSEPGVCPVCSDELEYEGVGRKPVKGVVCFVAKCKCGYRIMERYEFKGLNSVSMEVEL